MKLRGTPKKTLLILILFAGLQLSMITGCSRGLRSEFPAAQSKSENPSDSNGDDSVDEPENTPLPPKIKSVFPSQDATEVALNPLFEIEFDVSMNLSSLTVNTLNDDCEGYSIQISSDDFTTCIQMQEAVSADEEKKIIHFLTKQLLSKNTNYKLKVISSVQSEEEELFMGATYLMTTGWTTLSTPPSVLSVAPFDQKERVPVDLSNITVTFDQPIDPTSFTANTTDDVCSGSFQLSSDNFLNCVRMSTPVSYQENTVFSLQPLSNLEPKLYYKVRLTTAITDSDAAAMTSPFEQVTGFLTNNILINSSFEADTNINPPAGWSRFSAGIFTANNIDGVNALDGNQVGSFSDITLSYAGRRLVSDCVSIDSGVPLYLAAQIYTPDSNQNFPRLSLGMHFYTNSTDCTSDPDNYNTPLFSSSVYASGVFSSSFNQWEKVSTLLLPSNISSDITYGRMVLRVQRVSGTSSSEKLYFDQLILAKPLNLINNPSFAEDAASPPASWHYFTSGSFFQSDSTTGFALEGDHVGHWSSLTQDFTGRRVRSDCFKVNPSRTISARAFFRAPDTNDALPEAALEFRYFSDENCTTPASVPTHSQGSQILTDSNEWKEIFYSRNDLSSDAQSGYLVLRVRRGAESSNSSDQVYVDKVFLGFP
jgi:hypothetical protein